MQAERQLLFGLLALQNGFVSREQLVAAFSVWTLDKNRKLDEILLEQGALEPAACTLLAALVENQLERHDRDPVKSLAAVSSIDTSIREALRSLADPAVDASLTHLVSGLRTASEDPFVTRDPSVGEVSSQGTRFRILRPHAKGGLGKVSVALDSELNREVALKEILLPHADHTESRTRFVLEAEVTGGLEHPGIVPVYGLGYYADGRPFYAMKFIKGDSLKEAIARYHAARLGTSGSSERAEGSKPASEGGGQLELRQLLGRFIDVCNALQYAHDRRVLHRDLKPGNIMLGKYGETLIVDWGLAKVQGRLDHSEATELPLIPPTSASGSVEATLPGRAVGTPAYMSPEQAAGRLEELGPASDVYSLGATLYHLLTGKPPFAGDIGDVLRQVGRGEFPTPRSLNPAVAVALEATCLKAMSLRPENRYPSARLLADDIEHWLADEPVTAHRETPLIVASRWARKHRAWAISGTLALLAISIVAIVAAIWINSQKNVIETQNNEAIALANKESRARSDADEQRRFAEKQRVEADAARNTAEAAERELAKQVRLLGLEEQLRRKVQSMPLLWEIAHSRLEHLYQRRKVPDLQKSATQSFDKFLASQPKRFGPESRIAIQPFGVMKDPQAAESLRDFVSRFFGITAIVLPAKVDISLPESATRDRNGQHQYQASAIINSVSAAGRAGDTPLILVLTELDLFENPWRFVFGFPKPDRRTAILSLHGLRSMASQDGKVDDKTLCRLLKVAVFLTAQVAGIQDFVEYECGMNQMFSLTQLDARPLGFCPECERKVWWLSNSEPLQRYESLIDFARSHELVDEKGRWESELRAIRAVNRSGL